LCEDIIYDGKWKIEIGKWEEEEKDNAETQRAQRKRDSSRKLRAAQDENFREVRVSCWEPPTVQG
jgi:hypothetical protein